MLYDATWIETRPDGRARLVRESTYDDHEVYSASSLAEVVVYTRHLAEVQQKRAEVAAAEARCLADAASQAAVGLTVESYRQALLEQIDLAEKRRRYWIEEDGIQLPNPRAIEVATALELRRKVAECSCPRTLDLWLTRVLIGRLPLIEVFLIGS